MITERLNVFLQYFSTTLLHHPAQLYVQAPAFLHMLSPSLFSRCIFAMVMAVILFYTFSMDIYYTRQRVPDYQQWRRIRTLLWEIDKVFMTSLFLIPAPLFFLLITFLDIVTGNVQAASILTYYILLPWIGCLLFSLLYISLLRRNVLRTCSRSEGNEEAAPRTNEKGEYTPNDFDHLHYGNPGRRLRFKKKWFDS